MSLEGERVWWGPRGGREELAGLSSAAGGAAVWGGGELRREPGG